MTLATLLLIVAFVMFTLAAFSVNTGRFHLIGGGLALCVLSEIIGPVTVG
jgi:hypothetical protein